eukprot:881519-Amphidinium_carterae.2
MHCCCNSCASTTVVETRCWVFRSNRSSIDLSLWCRGQNTGFIASGNSGCGWGDGARHIGTFWHGDLQDGLGSY